MRDKSILEIKNYLEKTFSGIEFEKESHRYFVDGEEYQSVSSFLSDYTFPFEKNEIAKKVSSREKISQNEVLEKWNIRRDFSTVRGTEFHLYVETFLNSGRKIEVITPIQKEIKLFHQFWDKSNSLKYEVLTTELMVFSREFKIAGTIDCVVQHKRSKNFFIMDWKTNKSIRTESLYSKKMKPPLSHLDECELTKYSLQMGLYAKILSENTDLSIDNGFIIHFSRELGSHKVYPIADLQEEIKMILKQKQSKISRHSL